MTDPVPHGNEHVSHRSFVAPAHRCGAQVQICRDSLASRRSSNIARCQTAQEGSSSFSVPARSSGACLQDPWRSCQELGRHQDLPRGGAQPIPAGRAPVKLHPVGQSVDEAPLLVLRHGVEGPRRGRVRPPMAHETCGGCPGQWPAVSSMECWGIRGSRQARPLAAQRRPLGSTAEAEGKALHARQAQSAVFCTHGGGPPRSPVRVQHSWLCIPLMRSSAARLRPPAIRARRAGCDSRPSWSGAVGRSGGRAGKQVGRSGGRFGRCLKRAGKRLGRTVGRS